MTVTDFVCLITAFVICATCPIDQEIAREGLDQAVEMLIGKVYIVAAM